MVFKTVQFHCQISKEMLYTDFPLLPIGTQHYFQHYF